jgi:hypothetical protein
MYSIDVPQETKLTKRVFAMAGSSFFKCVSKVFGPLAIIIPVLALSGCGEGDGPTGIKNTAVPPLNLPPGFCDPINFEIECELPAIIWFGGGQTIVVDNPDKSGINQSDGVARMQKFGDQPFGGTRLNPVEVPVNFSAGQAFKMKVWSERPVPVTFKLEEFNDGSGGVEKVASHGGGSVWEELCFDFTTGVPGNPTIGLTIIFDNNVLGAAIGGVFAGDWTFYYDDITQVETCSDTPPTGIVPDESLYDPAATPPIPADVEVTAFDSQSVIDPEYAEDDTYSRVLAVSSGVGYGANVAQIGFIGGERGSLAEFLSLDFKVKGMPNNVIFVKLYDSVDTLRINLTSSGYSDELTDGWYQVSIPISAFNGVSLATGIVFESDNTAPMQFIMLLNDIGFSGTADDGGDDCDDGGATDPDAIVFDDDFGAGVSFAPFGGSINDVSVDSTEAYSGSASLKVVVPSAEYTGGALVADPARDLSAYDTLTFWAKASEAKTLNVAGVGDDASGSAPNSVEVTNLALTTDWQQFTITIPDPSVFTAATGLAHFAEGSDEGVYTIWFDEITYSSSSGGGGDCDGGGDNGGATDPDAIVFDDDYSTGVSFAEFGGSINDISVDSTEAYSGTASLKVVVPSAEYTGGALVADPARDLSAYDTVTFWAKASDAKTLNVAGVADDASGSAPNSVEVTNLALTTDWQQFTITIPDPSVLTANAGLFHFAEGSDEGVYTIWFDEIIYSSSSGGGGGGDGNFVNGDFENGLTGWSLFQFPEGVGSITADSSGQGGRAGTVGRLMVAGSASANDAVISQEFLGAGTITPGDSLDVTFDLYGSQTGAGGVVFVEVIFLNGAGEDVGGRNFLNGNPTPYAPTTTWTPYSGTVIAGTGFVGGPYDVSGGVVLSLKASCGPVPGCAVDASFDNVTFTIN